MVRWSAAIGTLLLLSCAGGPGLDPGWKRIHLKVFSLAMPEDLIQVPVKAIDSYVGRFEAPTMTLGFDWGQWSDPLTSSDGPEITREAHRLSRVKVNALLTVGLVLLWGLRVAGMMPAFWLLAVVIVWPLADRLTRRAVEHLLRPPGTIEVAGLPTLTAVFLERGLRAGLIIGALALLAWGWGIDLESMADFVKLHAAEFTQL